LIQEDIKLKKLKLHINSLLKKDIYMNKHIECCPLCGGRNYIKYGSYKGIQRYQCKECWKTFSKATNSLWSYSKKNPSQWIEFIELMMEKKSLRFCADKLNISLVTAFYWRHKILYGLKLDSIPNELKGDIYIVKIIIPENFKGCRKITTTWRWNIWIVVARDTEDSMIATQVCKHCWDLKKFNEKIYSKIKKDSYIIPYEDRYLSIVSKKHNKKLMRPSMEEDRGKYFIINLDGWLRSFHGVATKYLEEYLSFFVLFNLNRIIDYMGIMNQLSFGDRFIKIKEIGLARG